MSFRIDVTALTLVQKARDIGMNFAAPTELFVHQLVNGRWKVSNELAFDTPQR